MKKLLIKKEQVKIKMINHIQLLVNKKELKKFCNKTKKIINKVKASKKNLNNKMKQCNQKIKKALHAKKISKLKT